MLRKTDHQPLDKLNSPSALLHSKGNEHLVNQIPSKNKNYVFMCMYLCVSVLKICSFVIAMAPYYQNEAA